MMFWGSSAAATRLLPSLTADIVRLRLRPARTSSRMSGVRSTISRWSGDGQTGPQARARTYSLFGAALACLALAGPAVGKPERARATARDAAIVPQLNVIRAQAGLRPLRLNDELVAAARGHSLEMASLGYFSHDSANGESMASRVRVGLRRPPALDGRREPALVVSPCRRRPRGAALDVVARAPGDHLDGRLAGRRLRIRPYAHSAGRVRRPAGDGRHLRLRHAGLSDAPRRPPAAPGDRHPPDRDRCADARVGGRRVALAGPVHRDPDVHQPAASARVVRPAQRHVQANAAAAGQGCVGRAA